MCEPGEYFTWDELTRSLTASRYGIPNTPTPDAALAIIDLVEYVLDPLRRALKRPVAVTSGYRSPELNKRIGGSRTSQHVRGEAVDIRVRGYDARQLARFILDSGLPYDQLIWYAPSRGGHVHISYRKRGPNRREVRHAASGGGYPLQNP